MSLLLFAMPTHLFNFGFTTETRYKKNEKLSIFNYARWIDYLGESSKYRCGEIYIWIQAGFLGIWVHNEAKLSNQIVLRSELGFDSGIWGSSFYDKTGYVFTPVITADPRLYYNLNKRESKSKRIDGNSGNFVSLKTSFHPDWFVISNYDHVSIVSDISIVPTWGIKRNIGKHINYEAGIGIGYRYSLARQAGYVENESDLALNAHLRIGYRF